MENSERDGNTRPPDLPLEKFVCRSGSNKHVCVLSRSAAAAAKSLQSCPTLIDPMDCSLPGSSVHGIFQARVLEWGAIAFSSLCIYLLLIFLFGYLTFASHFARAPCLIYILPLQTFSQIHLFICWLCILSSAIEKLNFLLRFWLFFFFYIYRLCIFCLYN